MPTPAARKVRERDIQHACLSLLRSMTIQVERQNTGVGTYANADGTLRRVRFGKKGNLDLAGILLGRKFELEIKRPGERPTPHQYRRMNQINEAGGVAFWVDNAEILHFIITQIYIGKRVYIGRAGDVCLTDEPPDYSIEGWREPQ